MRFQVLDGWRGVAALLVAVDRLHAHGVFASLPFVRNSYLFVDFFFVLSGFVIAHAYRQRIVDGVSATAFAIRRFGRLWPLHAALLGVFVVFEGIRAVLAAFGAGMETRPFSGITAPDTILANLFLVQAMGVYDTLTWNVPSWSISTEFWAYILFAFVCLAAGRGILPVAAAIVVISLAIVGAFSPKAMDTTFDFAFFRCLAGFFTGVIVQAVFATMREATEGVVSRRAVWLEPAVVIVALAFVSFAGRSPVSLVAPLVFAALVYVFAFERGPISRVMQGRVFFALGAWSYSIYMVAYLVQLMFERGINLTGRFFGGAPWETMMIDGVARRMLVFPWPGAAEALVVAYLAAVLLLSAFTYRFVEEPARRAFNRVADRFEALQRRRQPAAAE